jgi:glycosyltransferase involved in cell wall biosynthesis
MKKVSIIIPVFNSEQHIEKCLKSLQKQTLKEIEIICVDDRSTDASYDILKQTAETDDRIKVFLNEENKGTLCSRKKGVEEATGEYIMFADNDDWYDIDACERLYERIKNEKVDILMYGVRTITSCEKRYSAEVVTLKRLLSPLPEKIKGKNCLDIENRINLLWNKVFRTDLCKKAYANIKDVRLTYAEDTYACWLMHYFAGSFMAVKNEYYNYNYKAGITGTDTMDMETFHYFCQCLTNEKKYVELFFDEQNALEEKEIYRERRDPERMGYAINIWRDKLESMDPAEGYDILLEYFDKKEVINEIHGRLARYEKLKEKSKRKEENLRKIKKSKSFIIGRIVTWLPRKIKKIGG